MVKTRPDDKRNPNCPDWYNLSKRACQTSEIVPFVVILQIKNGDKLCYEYNRIKLD